MFNTKQDRRTLVREKVQKDKQIKKIREKRYTKSDEKVMNDLLNQAYEIIYS